MVALAREHDIELPDGRGVPSPLRARAVPARAQAIALVLFLAYPYSFVFYGYGYADVLLPPRPGGRQDSVGALVEDSDIEDLIGKVTAGELRLPGDNEGFDLTGRMVREIRFQFSPIEIGITGWMLM